MGAKGNNSGGGGGRSEGGDARELQNHRTIVVLAREIEEKHDIRRWEKSAPRSGGSGPRWLLLSNGADDHGSGFDLATMTAVQALSRLRHFSLWI